MNEELKPCPFCGSKAKTDLSDFGSAMVYCGAEDNGVECPVNPETGFHDSRESAIAAWNKRTQSKESVIIAELAGRDAAAFDRIDSHIANLIRLAQMLVS